MSGPTPSVFGHPVVGEPTVVEGRPARHTGRGRSHLALDRGPAPRGRLGAWLAGAAALALVTAGVGYASRVKDHGWGGVESAFGDAAGACEPLRDLPIDLAKSPGYSVIGDNPESRAALAAVTAKMRGCLATNGVTEASAARLGIGISDPGAAEGPRSVHYEVDPPPPPASLDDMSAAEAIPGLE